MSWHMENPAYISDGKETILSSCLSEKKYADCNFSAAVVFEEKDQGCLKITHTWENISGKKLDFQPEISIKTCYAPKHYVIPGISYNGNQWGNGKEPKGLTCQGKPWIFDSRRTTIPRCTICENDECFTALMADTADENSQRCSCSLLKNDDGTFTHVMLYPTIEKPLTYCAKDQYSKPYEEFVSLAPGEKFTASLYVMWGKPEEKNFATKNVEEYALQLLCRETNPAYTFDQLQPLCMSHAKHLLENIGGKQLYAIGFNPGDGRFLQKCNGNEFGWCGQNGMYARMMIEYGLQHEKSELVDLGIGTLDAYAVDAYVPATGLVKTQYDRVIDGKPAVVDTCNLGFLIVEMLKAYNLLKNSGIHKPEYRRCAISTADFLVANYSSEYGFGKAWNADTGELVDSGGTIGAYIVPGLAACWQETGDDKYLYAAEDGIRFYAHRDLDNFMCTAGALDTCCIDKETSGAVLMGAMRLWEITQNNEFLHIAKQAGWYFSSWMMHQNVQTGSDSDFHTYGYFTMGGTSVSAQHHHIDPWGAFVVPEFVKLGNATGNSLWKKRARLMWSNAIQFIAPEEGKFVHGLWRYPGSQNEAYFHCRWGFGDSSESGKLNDWLVAWPEAYIMNTTLSISEEDMR